MAGGETAAAIMVSDRCGGATEGVMIALVVGGEWDVLVGGSVRE